MADHVYNKRSLVRPTLRTFSVPLGVDSELPAPSRDAVYRYVMGRDPVPRPMTQAELDGLGDSFARLILRRGERPMTVDAVLERLTALSTSEIPDGLADAAVPEERVFMLGEGGQIPWTEATAMLQRALRFVVACTAPGRENLVLLSVDERPGDPSGLLQVLSWDPGNGVYNFYQRKQGVWGFAGDGFDALDPVTRGKGPFDGHVNGSLVMKELRQPWLHWHSQSVSVPPEAFPPGHPILSHRFMTKRANAEVLETQIIQPGIDRWTRSRFDKAITNGVLSRAETFLRQLVETTSVNLIASDREFREVRAGDRVNVPPEILFNREALSRYLDPLAIQGRARIDGGHLLSAIERFGIALIDESLGAGEAAFRRPGEAFFALACPAPAYEDVSVIHALVDRGVLSRGLARALLAVDFCNPIQSQRRASLMRHMPTEGALGTGVGSCEAMIRASLEAVAAARPDSDEAKVLDWLATGDDDAQAKRIGAELAAYYEAAKARLLTEAGAHDLMRLIITRRRYFRDMGVSEFALTVPGDGLPPDAPIMAMTPQATLVEVSQLIV